MYFSNKIQTKGKWKSETGFVCCAQRLGAAPAYLPNTVARSSSCCLLVSHFNKQAAAAILEPLVSLDVQPEEGISTTTSLISSSSPTPMPGGIIRKNSVVNPIDGTSAVDDRLRRRLIQRLSIAVG